MSNLTISESELVDLLVESYLQGISSYAELAESSCLKILQNFIKNKTNKTEVNFTLSLGASIVSTSTFAKSVSSYYNVNEPVVYTGES